MKCSNKPLRSYSEYLPKHDNSSKNLSKAWEEAKGYLLPQQVGKYDNPFPFIPEYLQTGDMTYDGPKFMTTYGRHGDAASYGLALDALGKVAGLTGDAVKDIANYLAVPVSGHIMKGISPIVKVAIKDIAFPLGKTVAKELAGETKELMQYFAKHMEGFIKTQTKLIVQDINEKMTKMPGEIMAGIKAMLPKFPGWGAPTVSIQVYGLRSNSQ
ncbi:hypothetical protein [Wolbachia endosymbiont of Ctenocephalides felis wCfeT]|uniref:hypothetical protein n=1 Tax=Wolbachia endosymbiont of Ctenocephalides felis wCfeT TaxID=2732593 RepID=UPI001444D53C|nr:hypothetical protein [Wolbachia endosymbiont of Ctenocephalides felis wCfeT]